VARERVSLVDESLSMIVPGQDFYGFSRANATVFLPGFGNTQFGFRNTANFDTLMGHLDGSVYKGWLNTFAVIFFKRRFEIQVDGIMVA
jgi:hypothetical protein